MKQIANCKDWSFCINMKNIFKITFEFNGEQPEDINYINKALSSMKFSDLKIDKILCGMHVFLQ